MDFFTLTHNMNPNPLQPKPVQFGQTAYAPAFIQPALPQFKAANDTFERQGSKSPSLVHNETHHPDSFFHFLRYHVFGAH